jgi:hypothetical protein
MWLMARLLVPGGIFCTDLSLFCCVGYTSNFMNELITKGNVVEGMLFSELSSTNM